MATPFGEVDRLQDARARRAKGGELRFDEASRLLSAIAKQVRRELTELARRAFEALGLHEALERDLKLLCGVVTIARLLRERLLDDRVERLRDLGRHRAWR